MPHPKNILIGVDKILMNNIEEEYRRKLKYSIYRYAREPNYTPNVEELKMLAKQAGYSEIELYTHIKELLDNLPLIYSIPQ